MNPQHRETVEQSLADPRAAEVAAAQLANALRSLDQTTGSAATHWLERVYELVGRLALHQSGAGLAHARRLVLKRNPDAYRRHLAKPCVACGGSGRFRPPDLQAEGWGKPCVECGGRGTAPEPHLPADCSVEPCPPLQLD